jgi:hypothetical protein
MWTLWLMPLICAGVSPSAERARFKVHFQGGLLGGLRRHEDVGVNLQL